jgi:hypothetical protein
MRMAQLIEGKAELGDGAGLEVLHEHVGLGEHGREHSLVAVAREIEHQRLLAAIEPDEIGALAGNTVSAFTRVFVSNTSAFTRVFLFNVRAFTPVFFLKSAFTPVRVRFRQLVVAAREVALGPLDLDHARAGIGEAAGAHGRRHRLLDRDHQQA